ncbi:hypothetical protein, partial [Acinetobacter radioresistens]|uniref:hypothetical protein n=1 Tax=Acinetobacter radioresistens TaxID=40216 RepID=UPI000D0AE1E2
SVACSSKGLDGQYNRIDQTAFEKEQGMSSGLIVANKGTQVTLKNSWGDVALSAVEKDKKMVVQYNNQDAFLKEKKGYVISLTYVNKQSHAYKFKKD